MAVTREAFRAAFPAYRSALAFPDAQVDFYLALAQRLHAPDRWGDLLDYGIMLWIAHAMSMDAGAGVGGAPGALRGTVTSMSADGVSWSRDIGTATDATAGHWNLSVWGIRWRDLFKMVGAGPLQVGAPSVYDAWLSGPTTWAWPGPDGSTPPMPVW